jgi:hypothetical protein
VPTEFVYDQPWSRKHDLPGVPHIADAPVTAYVTSLKDVIDLCRDHPPDQRLHAAGTHWALSPAAISDHTFIETNDPHNQHDAMSRTLHNVVPKCLNRDFLDALGNDFSPKATIVHVEAGKRIYQLYSELDQRDPLAGPNPVTGDETLASYMNTHYGNPSYIGPWGFYTLGGAGGQTIVGAFNTGTHGGDFDRAPVADLVVAIHLVADGGKHYWVEPSSSSHGPLTDDSMMSLEFGINEYGGIGNFELIRDDDTFNAVLVSAGRFGVIYSVVLFAVPQYSLYERCRLTDWQLIKDLIKNQSSELYTASAVPKDATFMPEGPVIGRQRFLQIAVCLTPHANFTRNRVGVTQRWQLGLTADPHGRAERVGDIVGFDPRIQGPMFSLAGKSHAYSPGDDPTKGAQPSMLESACANASFLKGVIDKVIHEIDDLVQSHGAEISVGIATIAVVAGTGLLLLLTALFGLIVLLREILNAIGDQTRLGEEMNHLRSVLLDPPISDPHAKAAGLFVWQLIALKVFELLQKEQDYEAISYAIMDRRDYLNISCEVNGDSIEVFFDVVDDRLIAFIDALIAFEINQEFHGRAFVGYASLRFTRPSRALLGMQKHWITCSVEIAGLKDVEGSQELIDYASRLALDCNMGALVHWGQHNDYVAADVDRLYGQPTSPAGSDIARWRHVLADLTDSLDGFSSDFTRQRGLEVP